MKRSIILQTILIVSVLVLMTVTNSMGIEIPSLQKPVIASSVLPPSKVANYNPENVFDGDESTTWCEGIKGDAIGEWIAIYLGDGEELGDLSEIEIEIDVRYQKNPESFKNNGCPNKLLIELFSEEKVLAKTSIDASGQISVDKFKNR